MKIAILTSGRLPLPAVLGGAVENLIDFYLEYNDIHHLNDITVYSIKQLFSAKKLGRTKYYSYFCRKLCVNEQDGTNSILCSRFYIGEGYKD